MKTKTVLVLLLFSGMTFWAASQTLIPDLSEINILQPVNRNFSLATGPNNTPIVHVDAKEGPGVVWIKGTKFSTGTLEFDVKGKDVLQESFVGIAFHGVNDTTYESVYFRPFNFQATDPVRHKHAVQYIALPGYDWFKLRETFPDKYEHAIVPMVDPNAWFHVKIVLEQNRIQAFVNADPTACLSIQPLVYNLAGQIGFWVGNGADGDFANLTITWDAKPPETAPHIAFSFDDGNPQDILTYKGSDWNQMIVEHLKRNHINAAWFVAGKGVDNIKGKTLLRQWNDAGNVLANHTYSHLNFNRAGSGCEAFASDLLRCDSLISGYSNYKKIFRFPYLKTGNTIAKRDSMRAFLKDNGYQQGWVTIDASDWYVNSRLIQRLKTDPQADISGFRDFYLNHILERAHYYNTLSKELNHRQINHVVLLHFNLTSALFLGELIDRFKKEGWVIDNYTDAIKDPVFNELPAAMPSEQSLIWLMAKQTGQYEAVLRYPGEDGDYEKEKMDKLGL